MSQATLNPSLQAKLTPARIVPVLTIAEPEQAVPLARALIDGGMKTLEITLRTPASMRALHAIAKALPDVLVGAGTVLTPAQAEAATEAGARYLVSPGMTPALIGAAEAWRVPFLPGAATASEAMALQDMGYRVLKFFPAEAAGGVATLKSLAAPLGDVYWCPTGGITAANVSDYLALANVVSVGGSWVAPKKAVEEGEWDAISGLSREAMTLA
ncbi:MAG: bifunctional 4-hydroxy-2-oxoglutarate aldolase/2-dehydro-3-deoxy-phosphogluconate aldolase [Pseudomonadota bacterium]